MDFGRLTSVDGFDFTLPPDHSENTAILASKARQHACAIYLGLPIWAEKSWLGTLYPAKLKDKDFLKFYARQFNVIELNTTYYRIPTPQTIEGWKAATPAQFKFCPKIPQEISHQNQLLGSQVLTHAFCDVLRGLEHKLGTIFLQLPPHFGPEKVEVLKTYLNEFPRDLPLAVELRHPDWFRNVYAFQELMRFLEDIDVGTVLTDTAGRRDVLHMRLTTTRVFIRFTANDLHPTDFPRITDWVNRLADWKESGAEEIYFFIHSPSHTQMPLLGKNAANQFNQILNAGLKPCTLQDEEQPELF